MNKKKWILAGIMLLIGVPMMLIGWSMDKSGSTSTSMGLFIIGILLCAVAISGTFRALMDDLRDWIHK